MGATMSKIDPVITKCECQEPNCPGYLVDNVDTVNGRFSLQDAKLIAMRKELKALIPKFQATLRNNFLDAKERELVTYLNQLWQSLA